MGNNKSSHQLSNSFDKDSEFNSEADDGGFLEAKLKALDSAALNRAQTGRKSFHYIRIKENQDLAANGKTNGLCDKEQLVRVHSLPVNRIKKKSNTLGALKKESHGKGHNKIPIQGFDMFRHHLGQMNCDVMLFQQLESEIYSLNDKLNDIEDTRQSCLAKLAELSYEVRQNQLLASAETKVSSKRSKANDLALQIIDNYVQRIDHLLKVDDEPFLVDAKSRNASKSSQPPQTTTQPLSSQLEQSTKVETAPGAVNATARSKRQQIKDTYNQLIRSVMPRLFGKQFAHRDEHNYKGCKDSLAELRDQVNAISTSDEQKLVDAKRIFLQEIDGYLRTIDEMVTCSQKDCSRCKA